MKKILAVLMSVICLMSFGQAAFAEKTPEIITNEELIAHADKALYKAKNSGRNKVELYEQ